MNQPLGPAPAAGLEAAAEDMRPLAFEGLFGWLHRPANACDVGVVLVSAIGRDARCAHRPQRLFADQLAAAGYPVLRYDHRGTGDSLDLASPADDAVALWLADIDRAIAVLRQQAGVSRVVLGGIRLGASFAATRAAEACGLMLLAPVANGRSWLRKQRFSQAPGGGPDTGPLDADGVTLSAASAASLARLELGAAPAETPIFLAAQNRLAAACGQALSADGAEVRAADFPGFRELFLDAHSNLPPTAVFDQARDWMLAVFPPTTPAAPASTAGPVELRPQGAIERPVSFGVGLRGIYCAPQGLTARAPCVLFCNTGGDPRAGIGGFAAQAARALARQGMASLRFDFAGLGDSDAPAGVERPHVYETPREADMEAALAFLQQQGLGQAVVVGVCAGAYHALRAAARDLRIAGLFAVSPVKLAWRPGDSLAFGRKDDGKAVQAYARAARDPATWRRLVKGQVDLAAVSSTVARRTARRVGGLASRQEADSPLAEMRRFLRRGGRARLLMGLDDASLDEVETHFGRKGGRLRGMEIQVAPNLDHGLARSESRRLALASLLEWLGLEPERP